MKLILLSVLGLFLNAPFADAAARCLPAKSCKSRTQCYDRIQNKWSCTRTAPAKPGRRGSVGRGDPVVSEEQEREASRRLDDAMRRAQCESSGRCRDRTSSDPQPQDDLDRAIENARCASGGECIRP